jgi:hypothetical protein
MENMQITIPDDVRDFLATQATKHGFTSPSVYVQTLLADLRHRVEEKKEFERMLLDAIQAPAVEADGAFWAERRRKVLDKHPELKECPQFGTMKGTILYMAPDFDHIPEGFEDYLP